MVEVEAGCAEDRKEVSWEREKGVEGWSGMGNVQDRGLVVTCSEDEGDAEMRKLVRRISK